MPGPKRQLAAIMFTDIVGYTTLMGSDENAAFAALEQSRDIQKPLVEKYGVRWLKEVGDGAISSFAGVLDAVNCAMRIQESFKDDSINLKIAIHSGEVIFKDNDVFVMASTWPQDSNNWQSVTASSFRPKPGTKLKISGQSALPVWVNSN